jgi:xanthine dehydrogenase iron-sulfur cluster and FAD-binding subunit A
LKPVNACIRLPPSVAGKAVFNVESLAGDGRCILSTRSSTTTARNAASARPALR